MKTRTIVLVVILACVVVFVGFIAICGGFLYYAYQTTDKSVSPRIDELFAAMENGTYNAMYETDMTVEFRSLCSRKEYEKIGRLVKERLGPLRSKSMVQFNAQQFNVSSLISVVYSAKFEKGEGTISASLRNERGRWLFQGFNIQSAELVKETATVPCPHCGHPNDVGAKFCSDCGKSMVEGGVKKHNLPAK